MIRVLLVLRLSLGCEGGTIKAAWVYYCMASMANLASLRSAFSLLRAVESHDNGVLGLGKVCTGGCHPEPNFVCSQGCQTASNTQPIIPDPQFQISRTRRHIMFFYSFVRNVALAFHCPRFARGVLQQKTKNIGRVNFVIWFTTSQAIYRTHLERSEERETLAQRHRH